MKKKLSLLIVTVVMTIILFGISTFVQRKLINYEPRIKCYIAKEDILSHTKISKNMIEEVSVPIGMIVKTNIVQDFSEIEELYSKSDIYSGQIILSRQFDSKESLSIFEFDDDKERIAIKFKNAENAMSYQIKEEMYVNVYVTMRLELANNFLIDKERIIIGDSYDGYITIKLLEKTKILGVFDINGVQVSETNIESLPNSIMIAVTPDEAKQINLIRDIATFNITEVKNIYDSNIVREQEPLDNQ